VTRWPKPRGPGGRNENPSGDFEHVKIPDVYIERIRGLGYTEDEARFLYIVANHSGYFVPSQFLVLTGEWGGFLGSPKKD
jgi:hypothetical protein